MENPIYLSVVLSTYNDGKYIGQAVRSILDQTYTYFEFIIVNDGSTDDTLAVIRSFDDPRIIVIDKPNTGLVDSLNLGIRTARYEWIARMDGDDIAEPNRFEEEVCLIRDRVVIISSQCSIIDASGRGIGHTKFLSCRIGKAVSLSLGLPLIVHPAAIFRKSVFQMVGGYDMNMRVAEDYDLWCKMLSVGDVAISSKRLLKLRKHGGNVSVKESALQCLNDTIGYVKKMYSINRVLRYDEYESLRSMILSSEFYLKIYCIPDKSTFHYLIKQCLRFFYVIFSGHVRKVVRQIPR